MWAFDATSLYTPAMWTGKTICAKLETRYGFTEFMNDDLVELFKTLFLNRLSVFLKILYHNPPSLLVQHLPVNENF